MLIGMFDSGVGGLTVLAACKRLMPSARYLYLDDGAHAPYGDRSVREVTDLSVANVRLLADAGCDAIVIACNTATAAAASVLRRMFSLPIFGLEPAVKPALAAVSGNVLLLATPVTARLRRYPARVKVGVERTLACDIERAAGDPAALKALAERTLAKYSDYDAIVTGCSHYAHLIPYLPRPVFDGADGLAAHMRRTLYGF